MSGGMSEFGKALEHIRRCLFWDFAEDRLLNELQTPLSRDYFDRLMEGLTEAHDADVAKYDAENAKLREELDAAKHDLSIFSGRIVELDAENAKLRELVRILKNCADECGDCDTCPINDGSGVLNPWLGCDSLRDRMRELGVEVDA